MLLVALLYARTAELLLDKACPQTITFEVLALAKLTRDLLTPSTPVMLWTPELRVPAMLTAPTLLIRKRSTCEFEAAPGVFDNTTRSAE